MRITVVLIASCMAAAVAGCVGQEPAAPSHALRARLGAIGLASAGPPPRINVMPIPGGKGKGAAQGAGAAMASSFNGCLEVDPTGLCALASLVLSPFIALGGAVYGAVAAKPESEVATAQNAIAAVLEGQDHQALLLERFRESTQGTGRTVTPVRRLEGAAGEFSALRAQGLDTLLELRVARLSLGRKPGVNPPLHLRIAARVRLIDLHSGEELFGREFTYRSSKGMEFLQWAARDARPLRAAVAEGFLRLAREMATTLFTGPPQSGDERGTRGAAAQQPPAKAGGAAPAPIRRE